VGLLWEVVQGLGVGDRRGAIVSVLQSSLLCVVRVSAVLAKEHHSGGGLICPPAYCIGTIGSRTDKRCTCAAAQAKLYGSAACVCSCVLYYDQSELIHPYYGNCCRRAGQQENCYYQLICSCWTQL
jgi:hypothetical protein